MWVWTHSSTLLSFIGFDIASNQWIGWSGFGGTTDGGGKPAKNKALSKRRPEMTGRTPSDGKVSMELSSVWEEVSDKSYLPWVQTGPLYRGPGSGYLSQ